MKKFCRYVLKEYPWRQQLKHRGKGWAALRNSVECIRESGEKAGFHRGGQDRPKAAVRRDQWRGTANISTEAWLGGDEDGLPGQGSTLAPLSLPQKLVNCHKA